MDAVHWQPHEPEDVCSLCKKEVTPKTAVLMNFSDGVTELVCYECLEILEREGRQHPHDH